jgi:UDP-N-acetylmuramoyl-tripeptide--D-alanyl-D-alanine ligase
MRAAFEVLGRASLGKGGRRIAVLGDMLELGTQAQEMHASLAAPLQAAGIDLVFTCGTGMAALRDALPEALRGAHAAESKTLAAEICDAVRPGDSLLVKGSLGSRMAVVVEALIGLGKPAKKAANGQ